MDLTAKKTYLVTPGPTPVPDEVRRAMAGPALHHRTPGFAQLLEEIQEGLKYLFQCRSEVISLASSGTGAMEAAVANFFRRGDRVVVVRGGKFGERWGELCETYGLDVVPIEVAYGHSVEPDMVSETLDNWPEARGLFVQACETSTGALHDVQKLGEIVSSREGVLLVVDAITGVGVYDIQPEAWGLDVLLTGSQKALMLPPGLAMLWASEKAWAAAEGADLPRYYFDLRKERESLRKGQTAYTPAVSLMQGLAAALRRIQDEGLASIFERNRRLAKATRSAMEALGLALFTKGVPSPGLTAVSVPERVDGSAIPKVCRDVFGVSLAGGQGSMKGNIFRIAHFGFIGLFDVLIAVAAVEMTLCRLGFPVRLGSGVGAAEKVFLE